MKIGIVKEIKDKENRVALPPAGVRELVAAGHQVLIERSAGLGSGFSDEQYQTAGATVAGQEQTWDTEMVIKVKEPLPAEYGYLREQILFTFLHLAGLPRELTETLLARRTTAIAYETVEDEFGQLPLLAPMSAVAGNMAITVGSFYLARYSGGRGTQLGCVLGERSGKVVVLGDGVVGQHAARTACGMGANVHIAGLWPFRELELKERVSPALNYFLSTPENIAAHLADADLVVGAVLRRGARAPHLVTEEMVKAMAPGSVIVDVSIDQGGCVATSRPTSHSAPIFEKHGVLHYCVTNMPGAYPRTSTTALSRAILPYALRLAAKGVAALRDDPGFARGLNTYQGFITYEQVAVDLNLESFFKPSVELNP